MSDACSVLKEIERITQDEFLPIIGRRKGQVLVEVIRKVRPKRVLEVGTLVGYSTILMAQELENEAHLITVEIDEDEAKIARQNIKRAKVRATIDVIVGDAVEVIQKLTGKFDVVFIDAEKREYLQYLQLVERKLHKKSVIVADNAGIFADEMKDYLEYVRCSGKYNSKYVSVGEDGLEISIKQ